MALYCNVFVWIIEQKYNICYGETFWCLAAVTRELRRYFSFKSSEVIHYQKFLMMSPPSEVEPMRVRQAKSQYPAIGRHDELWHPGHMDYIRTPSSWQPKWAEGPLKCRGGCLQDERAVASENNMDDQHLPCNLWPTFDFQGSQRATWACAGKTITWTWWC